MNLETHLESLTENDARDFGRIVRLLKAQPEVEPSPDLCDKITAQLSKRAKPPKALWWVAAAASLAILFSLTSLLRQGSPVASEDIRWLAKNQEADGTWSPAHHGGVEAFRPALTALSLLALQQATGAYREQIAKGVSALERMQTAEGSFGGDDGQAQLYNLAVTTYALTRCGADSPALVRAIAHIRTRQEPDGSWTYAGTHEGNVAVTAWMTRALACAEAHGNMDASIPLRKGLRWLRSHVRDDGRMAYHPLSAPSDTLTALSAHSLIEAGKLFPDLQTLGLRMTDAISVQPPDTDEPNDYYRNYARIIAFESAGKTTLAASIRKQTSQMYAGSAPRDRWYIAGGAVYNAAFLALCRTH